MINIYKSESRYNANHGWLNSRFSFSFAEYMDHDNILFGPMRVLNDDRVAGHRGFGMHPHQEMEIVSLVLEGHLQHEDSKGHKAVTTFGEIQRMSAGTGIYHSEVNPSTEEVHFFQMWFLPEVQGLTPSYEKTAYDITKMKNNLLPVVTKNPDSNEVAHIHQDLTIYLSDIEAGYTIPYKQAEGRRIFIMVIEGDIAINGGETLTTGDSARITDTTDVEITSTNGGRFMFIDLP
ncbi:pirin family protein [Priestia taiwanensis]|uniref:Quercetin 2,3-dioxygenase n=1 Tax=Priestia taiwanensis TaxID=1347902 RepID=A0A917ASA7_9BACI|nr:pirin family protein [Priestia taiwanensis]MBM7364006.1 redox-sensitive bicupin YhaK (pirin superfamily) [Priestia taiwanensis]GGE70893.1 quercetin 2,3-dioxygenase [Priestia taiwanensis]